MSSMAEKSVRPSRFLFCLVLLSMSLLILSSSLLLQFSNKFFVPGSVFTSIFVNGTSLYFNPTFNTKQVEPPLTASVYTKQPIRGHGLACQHSSSSYELGTVGKVRRKVCDPSQALLRVFMYDLPPIFHFGLLNWNGSANQIWPDISNFSEIPSYRGGLNLQHSIEYWLTLDLLSSNAPNSARPCSAIRVKNSSEADVIFVPFFASLSYNRHSKIHENELVSRDVMLQDKLVEFLKGRDEWNRLGGRDHVIVAHHPNSMLVARTKLGSAMFVLADFGRYPVEIANIEKDVIAPYRHVVRTISPTDSAPFERRPILAYFRGAIYRKDGGAIRQELYYLLKDEEDVYFEFGNVQAKGINQASQGMASSKFCLNIAGDTPSSNRLFDAIASHCVPVIISDEIELPFEDVLDYSKFCVFVRSSDAVEKGFLLNHLRGIDSYKWTKMWERLKQVEQHFEYQYPSRSGDAVSMIWQAVSRKMSALHFSVNKKKRYDRSQLTEKTS